MIYFIHNETSRAIKIGHGWNPKRRQSTLQISNSRTLVLLGKIGGTKKVEQEIHWLVQRHDAANPPELGARQLCLSGEWFDDRILPFVRELMASPKSFLKQKEKKSPRARPQDNSLQNCHFVLECDSGEVFRESFILKTATSELAVGALTNIAAVRLKLLANTFRITRLVARGHAKDVDLRGALTASCNPRHGLAVVLNSETGGGRLTMDGIKHYSHRWLQGVPEDFFEAASKWFTQPSAQCRMLLAQFAQALNANHCVIVAKEILPVKDVLPDGLDKLPKGELRSKVNQKTMTKRKPRTAVALPKSGLVYFIQDTVTKDIKIGFCEKNAEKRRSDLQVGTPNPLILLGKIAGTDANEKQLHRRFLPFHCNGEWFSSEIAEDVSGILNHSSLTGWMRDQAAAKLARATTISTNSCQRD